MLLNNDTLAEPQWLQSLVDALDADPRYDFAASLMLLYYTPDTVNAAGDTYSIGRLHGHNRGLNESRSGYAERKRVLGASAGASMYRRTFFDDVGLFDEDFFLLHEDTDINLRALIAGKKCLYVPEAVVLHKHHATIGKQPAERIKLIESRNRFIVVGKDWPWPLLVLLPFLWLWRELRETLPLRPAKWKRIPGLIGFLPKKWGAEWAGLRGGLTKRKSAYGRRKVGTWTIVRWVVDGVGDYEPGE